MNEMLSILQKHLEQYSNEREDIVNKLKPLENQKKKLDEKIETIEHLISLEGGSESNQNNDDHTMPETSYDENVGSLSGKSGQNAYKELINSDLNDRSFKEKEIREIANEKGLRINNKFITGSYSRALLNRLIEQGDLTRIKKGVFGKINPQEGFFDIKTLNTDNSKH